MGFDGHPVYFKAPCQVNVNSSVLCNRLTLYSSEFREPADTEKLFSGLGFPPKTKRRTGTHARRKCTTFPSETQKPGKEKFRVVTHCCNMSTGEEQPQRAVLQRHLTLWTRARRLIS
ncbi:hypothetical protein F5Y01DRAFT_146252 [Xylaria sp. FL0043]|nr:hypothetical protein F5Y01DRAFT_146252 [Xylaria sp. FL0043]